MINSQDIKKGTCIRFNGKLYFCVDFQHVKPGKGNTFMRVTLKSIVDGRTLEHRFDISEKLEDVRVERRQYQYLYKEGDDFIFMNQEDYEQIPLNRELITGVDFLKESDVCEVVFDTSTETVLFAELPIKTVLEVTYTEPGFSGNTTTTSGKPATLENGLEIEIKDNGKGYDVKSIPTPNLTQPKENGLGLFIIKTLMDDVKVESKDNQGTIIKMTKYLGVDI